MRATDILGNVGEAQATVWVDTAVPSAPVLSRKPNSTTHQSTVTFEVVADEASAQFNFELWKLGKSTLDTPELYDPDMTTRWDPWDSQTGTLVSGTSTRETTFSNLPLGRYRLKVRTRDVAHNVGSWTEFEWDVVPDLRVGITGMAPAASA